jgi:hypothetical protein
MNNIEKGIFKINPFKSIFFFSGINQAHEQVYIVVTACLFPCLIGAGACAGYA